MDLIEIHLHDVNTDFQVMNNLPTVSFVSSSAPLSLVTRVANCSGNLLDLSSGLLLNAFALALVTLAEGPLLSSSLSENPESSESSALWLSVS